MIRILIYNPTFFYMQNEYLVRKQADTKDVLGQKVAGSCLKDIIHWNPRCSPDK